MDTEVNMKLWMLVLVGLSISAAGCAPAADVGEPTLVYLVRHAERAEDGTNDPPLSEAGHARAAALAHVLADAGVQRVFSTDYQRTRLTATPVAASAGVSVETYDPGDLPSFAEQLKGMSGRILVAGHSNTTPELVGLLGGDPIRDLPEWEYDRFYVVVLEPSGAVRSTLLRYGTPASEPAASMR